MLTDPMVTKLGATTVTLPRTTAGKDSAVYRDPNFRSTEAGETGLELSISHQYGKRTRRTVRINANKVAAGATTFTSSPSSSMSVYVVLDAPVSGFNKSEQEDILESLFEILAEQTVNGLDLSATSTRWIDGES